MVNLLKINRAVLYVFLPMLLLIFVGQASANDYVNQQAIVKIGAAKSVQQAAAAVNGSIIDSIPGQSIYLISYPDSLSGSQALSELNNDTNVVTAQSNHLVAFTELSQVSQSLPDQSDPPLLYGSSPPNYFGHPGYDLIEVDSAHKISTGEDVVVAIIDNGIDFDHPLFDGVFAGSGFDFVDNDTLPAEDSGSLFGHGTFVAGIVIRIAPDCKLLPLRAFDEDGWGNVFDIAEAVYYAIDAEAQVLNMSFGFTTDNLILNEAIDAAFDANIAMAAAAGNDSSEVATYPAKYKGVITVSSLDTLDVISDFSNYGDFIDICAPGEQIYSSLAGYHEWGTWSGTSFSAPMASGVCALLLYLEPALDSDRIEELIQLTAEKELQWGTVVPDDFEYGHGRLSPISAVSEFNKGDVDCSGVIDNIDKFYLQEYLYEQGPPPLPKPEVGDLDCSGDVDITDYIILINYIENGGPKPTPCE